VTPGVPTLVLAGILAGHVAVQGQAVPRQPPPLPTVALETFPDEARASLEAALVRAKGTPREPSAVGGLGITLQAWEQWEAAHAAYQRAQALAPDAADWWHLDGLVLLRMAQYGEAAAAFEAALQRQPALVAAQARLAEARFEEGGLDASRRAYQALASRPEAAPVGALGLGRIAARQGRHDEAVAHFEKAIALYPEFAAAYYGLAQSLRALGRRAEAAAALEQQRRHGTRWPAIDDPFAARVALVRDDPRGHLFRGLRLAELGDLDGAIAAHEDAITRNPTLAQARANLISLYGQAGKYADAERHYRALLEIGYNLDEAHYNYGVLLGLQKRWAESEQAFARAVAANPLHAQARNNLGQMLEGRGDVAGALEQYRAAVAADPSLRVARYNLGRMHLARKRPAEAVVEFERLREPVDAESARYLYALAVAHIQDGNREHGVALAREARDRAARFGEDALVAAIDRDLASLK
jgi:tetratricopeptide (TPR) repeat protein